MAGPDFSRKVGNTAKAFEVTPLDGTGAKITSFPAGTTVKFVAWNLITGVEIINAAATIVAGTPGPWVDFKYVPSAPDVAVAGYYGVRWDVTYLDGTKDAWPIPGHQYLLIEASEA